MAALGGVTFAASMLLARVGTARTRIGAALILAGVLALCVAFIWRERRLLVRPRTAIAYLVGRVDEELAGRAIRAVSLLDEHGEVREKAVSPVLARLHVARAVASIPERRIAEGAERAARAFTRAFFALAIVCAAVIATNPWGIVEGFDVLLARNGVAPIGMHWLVDSELRARPPDYLHMDEKVYVRADKLVLPRGSLLTFKGVPAHAGRKLALSDGKNEVPFVDDGATGVVARWPLTESVSLRIVARFGEVVIEEPDALELVSIPDEAPLVTLEGAPRTVFVANEDTTEIPIRYEASDDHGLREVHLVLRAGTREERRVLARLDGETRRDSGGHVLRASDAFVKRSHVPVEIRVEAKDNDPITGPKWGASEPITLVPPDIGEPEALRLDALRKLRDRLVDGLAWRLESGVPKTDLKKWLDEEKTSVAADESAVEATLVASYAGLRIPSRLASMIRGQMRKVREAMDAEARAAGAPTHAKLVTATEKLVLVVDGVIRGLGQRDAQTSAKQLADVADDLALGLAQMQRATTDKADDASRGAQRADASEHVLQGGRKQLAKLGSLGRDLGEIIEAYLMRVDRGRKDAPPDLPHAELAARDLAVRLHQPDPSFGAKGKLGHGGGESGGGRGSPGAEEGDEGEGERAFQEAVQDLESLARDHAAEIGKVERALSSAETEAEQKQLAEEGKAHAKNVREAVKDLPSVGAGSDSWTSKGAAAREHADQMARALESGNAADAVQSGRSAIEAIDEAKRIASRERIQTFRDPSASDGEKRLDEAKKKLQPELRWAEQRLEEMRKRAAQRASGELQKAGDEEYGLADRAGKLGNRAREQGSLPDSALQSLDAAEQSARDAASALKRGDADRALEHQREAQRALEAAREAIGREQDDGDDGQPMGDPENGRARSNGHADIPKADAHKGPEEFRRRVIKGLGQPGPSRHRDAVERYAEGLLR